MANTEYPWRYRLKNGEPELVPEPEPNWRSLYFETKEALKEEMVKVAQLRKKVEEMSGDYELLLKDYRLLQIKHEEYKIRHG
jgi:hypothetical protein